MELHKLDAGLRGSRDYIQGSQVLSRAAELLSDQKNLVLRQAKFSRISHKQIFLSPLRLSGKEHPLLTEIGYARFSSDEGYHNTFFFEKEDGQTAKKIDEVVSPIVSLKNTSSDMGEPEGTAEVSFFGDLEGVLSSVIAVTKRLHQDISPDVSDVWFTGLQRASIPVIILREKLVGNLTVSHISSHKFGSANQTLSNVVCDFGGSGMDQISAVVSFSYRP